MKNNIRILENEFYIKMMIEGLNFEGEFNL